MGNEVSMSNAEEGGRAGSAIIATAARTLTGACGSLKDTFEEPSERNKKSDFVDADDDASFQTNPMSQMFARALISEVMTTMTPAEMAEREKALLKAQQRAKLAPKDGPKPIGAAGMVPSSFDLRDAPGSASSLKHRVTIGVCLSRRHPTLGHPDTITRQSAFDFNELQDRSYQYVSSTDEGGWRAGGGEHGASSTPPFLPITKTFSEDGDNSSIFVDRDMANSMPFHVSGASPQAQKVAAPDTVHIPIIDIDCESQSDVDSIIDTLARGEVFIPHMAILPISLGVNGMSPPDLVANFTCERSDDLPPDEWSNWCLEFMHNQLYEYFYSKGARWMNRPFQITLAKKVRWKTAKHMNKYFAKAEAVISRWKDNGSQYLDPQRTHLDGGASPEEVSRPHGIYLLRNGIPTNYFPPNISPPYSTKMTRTLLSNVIEKSWDKKRRDWSSEPVIGPMSPAALISTFFGCNDAPGYLASEATFPRLSNESFNSKNGTSLDISPPVQTRQQRNSSDQHRRSPDVPTMNPHDNAIDSFGHIDFSTDHVGWETTVSPSIKNETKHSNIFQPFEDETVASSKYDALFENVVDLQIPENTAAHHSYTKKSPPVIRRNQGKDDELVHVVNHIDGKGGESQTTEPVNNASSARIIQQEREKKREREIERENERKKVEELEKTLQQKLKMNVVKDDVVMKNGGSPRRVGRLDLNRDNKDVRPNERRLDGDGQSLDHQYDRMNGTDKYMARKTSPLARKNSVSSPSPSRGTIANSPLSTRRQFGSTRNGPPLSPAILSQESTDYSLDDTTAADGSLIGTQYAGDASVFTATSENRNNIKAGYDSSFQLPASTPERVPTDEELYAVGWAKAFDHSSGAYYYFTLDRTTIVWDNPLSG